MLGLIYSLIAAAGKLAYDGNKRQKVQHLVAVSEERAIESDAQIRKEREDALRCELDTEGELRRKLRLEIDEITSRRQEIVSDTTRVLSVSERQELDELAQRKSELWQQYDVSLRKSYRRT